MFSCSDKQSKITKFSAVVLFLLPCYNHGSIAIATICMIHYKPCFKQ